ncbi:MAG: Hsp70 family protein [Pirellulaceae bacterium]
MHQYSVGIDLGTTNCVVAYSALNVDRPHVQLLRIEQVTAPNETEAQPSLASFLYIPTTPEHEAGLFQIPSLPAYPTVNGSYARTISAEQPERTIAAAKSWLCHGGVDRHAPILPWQSPEEIPKFSPTNASKLLLRQLVDAWDQEFPEAPLHGQLVTLTVPASFDMSARELTREAALSAGLPDDFILLEEPQAAVYHWMDKAGDSWRQAVGEGDSLLVCDIGGGTTDLTMVRVEQEHGELILRRVAVGNHLLVGGDNMDLALAHFVATKFAEKGTRLNAWQSVALWHSCRRAKESLLSIDGPAVETISVLGRGSKLIGGTVSVEIQREEVQQLLIDGFFPMCEADARPEQLPHSGLHELGLPFEADSAITRHVASFLSDHYLAHQSNDEPRPLHLLLNGGVFKSDALQMRLGNAITHILAAQPKTLGDTQDLDYSVARGAAYYGWAKQRGGVRIRGGAPRSYYVGIETAGLAIPGMPRPLQAVCVVPLGMEEGTEAEVPGREVGLVIGKAAKFRFFAAADRPEDTVGQVLREWDENELIETSPLELELNADEATKNEQGFVPVKFLSRVSELGVLELWCKSTRDHQQWKLEFSIRGEESAPGDDTADPGAASSHPSASGGPAR